MGRRRIFWSSWLLTRVVFSAGVLTLLTSILRLVTGDGWGWWLGLVTGAALLALSTRGPWDAADSGRNRSVLGFTAREQSRDHKSR
ncbi:hypothetical protein [Arthrobacter sp. GMC3]|uniref:hypothetical protein n=1 Tax=Arthrobacter sp. GMC3 TaxID=2058894 RepID=UPI0015E43D6E|nr:hypothetical protein [Arthrobacter sp. GMC3]